uniref:Uncharacterized protein LOC110197136 isoform X2 n=1 Tax=Phascolarctos cinereus TaxID=38626 RepID=A0A6P5J644_PHACI|nr:uncharacterized protein LOC110197136 isoform X2 [Phascolarctos cinereus]
MRGEKAPLDLDFKGEYRRPARTELNRYIRLRRRKCQGQRSAAGHPPIPATGSHGCQPQGRCKGQTQADPHISWGPALQIPDGDRDSGCVDECFGAARSPAQGLQPLLGPALPRPASSSSAARGVCNKAVSTPAKRELSSNPIALCRGAVLYLNDYWPPGLDAWIMLLQGFPPTPSLSLSFLMCVGEDL